MNWLRGTTGTLLVAAMATVGSSCTLLLDHSAVQCKNNEDCATLGTYPICQNSLCVPSGLQPNKCFPVNPPQTVPMMEDDFLNACGTSALLPGSNDPLSGCLTFTTDPDPGAMISTPKNPGAAAAKLPTAPTSPCKDLVPQGKQILYLSGSSNFPPLLQELSQVIVKSINIVPVFRTTTSCVGVKSMNMGSATYGSDHFIMDPVGNTDPYPSYAQIFLGDGNAPVNCLLGPGGAEVDVGESEIAQATCGPPMNPTDTVLESVGPILPIVFVVPKTSNQKVMSVDAAHQILGGGGGVPPWESKDFLFIRGQGTATLRLVAQLINLMPAQVWGIDQGNATNMAANLGYITDPVQANEALGIIGTDFYDINRGGIKALGLQVTDQKCAYLPDSTLATRDKVNVRDGHYPLWGRIHFFAARANGMPVSSAAAAFLPLFTGPMFDPQVLAALIKAGFVPPCAMKVTRDSELGDFIYNDPPAASCGCAFDKLVNAPPRPECTPCSTNDDCTSSTRPSCYYNFCEQEPS